MRLVYLPCILLAAIICTCAGNVVPPKEETQTHEVADVTTAMPSKPTNAANPTVVSDDSKTPNALANNISTANISLPNSISNVTNATTAFPMTSSVSTSTTAISTTTTTTTIPVTKLTTTKKPETTTEKITTSNVPPSTTTNSPITVSPPSATTAVPISTKEAPPSQSPDKGRDFDGLSFVGGIILAVCLMAIGTFSCKLYKRRKEGNYRTL
nr:uncharacterized protein PB18E9.04c-like [Nomia melanderi]